MVFGWGSPLFIVIFLCLCVVAFIFLFSRSMKKTNIWKTIYGQTEKFRNVPDQLQIVNTGSTFLKFAVDYQYTELKGFNFALQPQSMICDFKVLKQYSENIVPNGIVLIGLVSFSFGFEDYEEITAYDKYYTFLNKRYIPHYSFCKNTAINYTPVFLYAKHALEKAVHFLARGVVLPLKTQNRTSDIQDESYAEKCARERWNSWVEEFGLEDYSIVGIPAKYDMSVFPATRNLLENILQFCVDHGFRPAILIPPVSREENELIDNELLDAFLYDNIRKANTVKAPVLNYLKDPRFQDSQLYYDADCLNEEGRKQFAETLFNDLKRLKYF